MEQITVTVSITVYVMYNFSFEPGRPLKPRKRKRDEKGANIIHTFLRDVTAQGMEWT